MSVKWYNLQNFVAWLRSLVCIKKKEKNVIRGPSSFFMHKIWTKTIRKLTFCPVRQIIFKPWNNNSPYSIIFHVFHLILTFLLFDTKQVIEFDSIEGTSHTLCNINFYYMSKNLYNFILKIKIDTYPNLFSIPILYLNQKL